MIVVCVFGVEGMDCLFFYCGYCIFDKVIFVQGVGVDYYLNIYIISYVQIVVDCCRGGVLIFVQFQIGCVCVYYFMYRFWQGCVIFVCDGGVYL